jgi:hypothetical protein
MPIMDAVGYMLVGLPSIYALNTDNLSPLGDLFKKRAAT